MTRITIAWMAALALAVAPAGAGSKREEAQKLMKTLAKDKDSAERASAAERLGDMGATDAVPALATALKDRNAAVRANAAAALWKLGEASREAMPALREALEDPDGAVLINAAGALRELGVVTTELVPAYRRAFLYRDCTIRVLAALAVVAYVPAKELLPIGQQCQGSDDFDTSSKAGDLLRALTKSKDKGLVAPLLDSLRTARGSDKAHYAYLLADLKPPSPEVVTALTRLVGDPEPENRKAAISVLSHMGAAAKGAIPVLTERVTGDKDPEVREDAAEALGDLAPHTRSAIPVLIQALQKDASPKVRAAACYGLQEMHEAAREAIPALNAALKDQDAFVRGAAQRALMRVDPKR